MGICKNAKLLTPAEIENFVRACVLSGRRNDLPSRMKVLRPGSSLRVK